MRLVSNHFPLLTTAVRPMAQIQRTLLSRAKRQIRCLVFFDADSQQHTLQHIQSPPVSVLIILRQLYGLLMDSKSGYEHRVSFKPVVLNVGFQEVARKLIHHLINIIHNLSNFIHCISWLFKNSRSTRFSFLSDA